MKPREVLEKYVKIFEKALRDSLEKHKAHEISNGSLYSSIHAYTRIFGQSVELIVTMNDYWKFIDKGVSGTQVKYPTNYSFKGKNVNQEAMLKMIANGGIKVEMSKRQKKTNKSLSSKFGKRLHRQITLEKKRKTLAFILGRSIAKKGIKPNRFASRVFESRLIDKMRADLIQSVGREIKLDLLTIK